MVLKDEILQPDILSLMRNLRSSDIFNKKKKDICECFHNSLAFSRLFVVWAVEQVRIFLLSGGKRA